MKLITEFILTIGSFMIIIGGVNVMLDALVSLYKKTGEGLFPFNIMRHIIATVIVGFILLLLGFVMVVVNSL